MPPRRRKTTPPPAPVITRNMLDLPTWVRKQAIAVAGGDASRVKVIGPGSYEVANPAFIPEATAR